jgi:hypothetical protein
MNARILVTAASAALIGTAVPSMATTVFLVDDFNVDQRVEDLPTAGATNNSQVSGGDIIGGWRDLLVDTDRTNRDAASVLQASGGQLDFDNAVQTTGRAWVTYDGAAEVGTDPTNVDRGGLGGLDFLAGGPFDLTGFLFEVIDVDLPGFYIEIRAWDTGTGYSEYTETLPEGGGNPFVFLNQFTGDINWRDVGALQFFAQTGPGSDVPALDGAIGRISVEVIPLPAPALLLLAGIGGLGALRLRRRAA